MVGRGVGMDSNNKKHPRFPLFPTSSKPLPPPQFMRPHSLTPLHPPTPPHTPPHAHSHSPRPAIPPQPPLPTPPPVPTVDIGVVGKLVVRLGMKNEWEEGRERCGVGEMGRKVVRRVFSMGLGGRVVGVEGSAAVRVLWIDDVAWEIAKFLKTPSSKDMARFLQHGVAMGVEMELRLRVDPNAAFGRKSVLAWALQVGDLETMGLLIRRGATVWDRGAVVTGLKHGMVDGLEVLVAHGVDLKMLDRQVSDDGGNPLLCKAVTSEVSVSYLLEKSFVADCDGRRDRTPLLEVISEGVEGSVKALLEAGADPNWDRYRKTPLEAAVKSGRVGCLKLLLENGGDPNKHSEDNYLPLKYAIDKDRKECMRMLLDTGADPCLKIGGWDPPISCLKLAVLRGTDEMVEMMLGSERDLKLNDVSVHGRWNLLVSAMDEKSLPKLRLLLEAGADPCMEYAVGKSLSCLCVAIPDGSDEMVEMMLGSERDLKLNDVSAHGGWNLLTLAVYEKSLPKLRLLLEAGADPCMECSVGSSMSCLWYAIADGSDEMVQMMLGSERDLKLNDVSVHGRRNLLVTAMYNKSLPKLRLLLEAGADPNLGDPLQVAIKKKHLDIARALLDAGAVPTMTSWQHAANRGGEAAATMLLDHAHHTTAIDSSDKRPLSVIGDTFLHTHSPTFVQDMIRVGFPISPTAILKAFQHHNRDHGLRIAHCLMSNGVGLVGSVEVAAAFRQACKKRYVEWLRVIVAATVPLECHDEHGNSLLHIAASEGVVEGVRLLLASLVDHRVLNTDGHRALEVCRCVECVRMLLEYER